MLDKTYRTEFRRRYLIHALPAPLTRASRHLQIFDNYLSGTRMRIRSVRDPQNRTWNWTLQQRLIAGHDGPLALKIAEIHLNEAEHSMLEGLASEEVRKNRYFHEVDGGLFAFDIYLGKLWGVNIASVEFENESEFAEAAPPSFAVFDVSSEPLFLGESLAGADFEEVRQALHHIAGPALVQMESPD
jgi:CYTH domain-containing protein